MGLKHPWPSRIDLGPGLAEEKRRRADPPTRVAPAPGWRVNQAVPRHWPALRGRKDHHRKVHLTSWPQCCTFAVRLRKYAGRWLAPGILIFCPSLPIETGRVSTLRQCRTRSTDPARHGGNRRHDCGHRRRIITAQRGADLSTSENLGAASFSWSLRPGHIAANDQGRSPSCPSKAPDT